MERNQHSEQPPGRIIRLPEDEHAAEPYRMQCGLTETAADAIRALRQYSGLNTKEITLRAVGIFSILKESEAVSGYHAKEDDNDISDRINFESSPISFKNKNIAAPKGLDIEVASDVKDAVCELLIKYPNNTLSEVMTTALELYSQMYIYHSSGYDLYIVDSDDKSFCPLDIFVADR